MPCRWFSCPGIRRSIFRTSLMLWIMASSGRSSTCSLMLRREVSVAEKSEVAGSCCRYAPRGYRSIAANRPTLSEPLEAYVQRANDDVICLVMVETTKALENVEAIARAPEIDGLYIGPSDLSLDMGLSLANWPNDDRHVAAVQRIFAAAKANGRVACHHGAGPAVSAKFVQMGSMLCQIGNDVRMLSAATAEALQAFRQALA